MDIGIFIKYVFLLRDQSSVQGLEENVNFLSLLLNNSELVIEWWILKKNIDDSYSTNSTDDYPIYKIMDFKKKINMKSNENNDEYQNRQIILMNDNEIKEIFENCINLLNEQSNCNEKELLKKLKDLIFSKVQRSELQPGFFSKNSEIDFMSLLNNLESQSSRS